MSRCYMTIFFLAGLTERLKFFVLKKVEVGAILFAAMKAKDKGHPKFFILLTMDVINSFREGDD